MASVARLRNHAEGKCFRLACFCSLTIHLRAAAFDKMLVLIPAKFYYPPDSADGVSACLHSTCRQLVPLPLLRSARS